MPRRGGRRPPEPSPRVLTDPRAIRAMAHPARLAVLDALRDGDDLTATELAATAGVSPSAMSYHLRALEKYGFVERAPGSGDGRQRPWRAIVGGVTVEPDAAGADQATAAVTATMMGRATDDLVRWYGEVAADDPWRELAGFENQLLWLTPDEAQELARVYRELTGAARGRTRRDHPVGARRVRALRVIAPVDRP